MFSADVRKRVPVSGTCFGARAAALDPDRRGPAVLRQAAGWTRSAAAASPGLPSAEASRPGPGVHSAGPSPTRRRGERAGCAKGHQRNGKRALPCAAAPWGLASWAAVSSGHGPRALRGHPPTRRHSRRSPTGPVLGGLPSRPASTARPPDRRQTHLRADGSLRPLSSRGLGLQRPASGQLIVVGDMVIL